MRVIAKNILDFYQKNKREMPWRTEKNPYYTLVSEIMLQQTRVDTVIPYFIRFIEELPTIEALAHVEEDVLYKLWQGLGYYRRAANLKKCAIEIKNNYQGIIPKTYKELISLPGIGPYTAKAILSIAYDEVEVAIDGNVSRVFSRFLGIREDITIDSTKKLLEESILNIHPQEQSSDFMQALMEIGALICLPNGEPLCEKCPLREQCFALKQNLISEIPLKPKKEIQKKELKTVFTIHYNNQYFIQKREEKGLLSSLWEFPNTENHLRLEEAKAYIQSLGYHDFSIQVGKKLVHKFTHIVWDMISYDILLENPNNRLRDRDLIEKEYSIPTAFIKFIE